MIKQAISNPYAVFVGMAIVVIFGGLSMMDIPIQLKPSIEPAQVNVTTYYWGASPLEVEDQITNKIEKELASLADLERIVSSSQEGVSTVSLVFVDSAERNRVLIDVVQGLKRVTDLPEYATEPVVSLTSMAQGEQIMWLSLDGEADLDERYDMVEEVIQPELLRVGGVGEVLFFGGVERKIVVQPDPDKMVAHGISMNQLAQVLAAQNLNARGGYVDEGIRQFMVRTVGKFVDLDDIRDTVIFHGPAGTIKVSDVATVIDGRDRKLGYVHVDGLPSIAIGISRQSGANTVTTIHGIEKEVERFNGRFKTAGLDMQLNEAYSELHYVEDAISLVRNNLMLGALLAAIVLAMFLRAGRPILIVLVTIPVSLITVFLVLNALGRTINIISLAGIAFSVGLVIDNAIVVLENIDRHMRTLGKPPVKAALDAINEISGAIFASTLTTVAVFLPVMLNTTEAGLLFKDIAIAIVSALVMSLVAANTVVPSLGALFLRMSSSRDRLTKTNPKLSATLDIFELQWLGRLAEKKYQGFLAWVCQGSGKGTTAGRLLLLLAVLIVFLFSLKMMPAANYLPNGTREFIFCYAIPQVGQRNEETIKSFKAIEEFANTDDRILKSFTVSSNPFFTGMGLIMDKQYVNDQELNKMVEEVGMMGFGLPGFRVFMPMRASIFQVADKQFTLEITGPDLKQLKKTYDGVLGQLFGMQGLVLYAYSDYTEGVPELVVDLDKERTAELGENLRSVAANVEMLLGGRDVSTFSENGREYDLMVRADPKMVEDRDSLEQFKLVTNRGQVVSLGEIATITEATGPSAIRHYNRQRSIMITVMTNPQVPTQIALNKVQEEIIGPVLGQLPPGYNIKFGEAADKLRETLTSMITQSLLAIVIIYLLLVSLFRSFSYPLVILVTIPLAWSGSFLAMAIASRLSGGLIQLDVLGMLGLIILTGIVVNNAILIVHQMINNSNAGMEPLKALHESAQSRLRPISMSVLTSVFGMLPLAVGSGSGSELYRGLGIIVVGGLLVSTIFTLFVVPTILSFIQERREQVQG